MLHVSGEFAFLDRLRSRLPGPSEGEVWIGDDAAVVHAPAGWLLLATDTVVEGVHADLGLTGLDDFGWKAMAANLSDVAAMGGEPAHALVAVSGPPGTDLARLYDGIEEASRTYRCPVVGGDLSNCPLLVVTVAATGTVDGDPVRRRGAAAGDRIWVTGPLGASAAGLRSYRSGAPDGATPVDIALRLAHARPRPELAAGRAARLAGATAMVDVSDGFAADLGRLAVASDVGVALDQVPVAEGATEAEALGGGEDYRLVFTAADDDAVQDAFAGLETPQRVGVCTPDPGRWTLRGRPLDTSGYEHDW